MFNHVDIFYFQGLRVIFSCTEKKSQNKGFLQFLILDEVIKKRLLIDGDAGNDEKRLTNLLKAFIRWCNSDDSGEERYFALENFNIFVLNS